MKIQSESNNTYDLLKAGLKASNVRAKTIANNMANINTKNYKKFSVVFEENLKEASDSGFKMRTTNENHYTSNSSNLKMTKDRHLSDDENSYGDNKVSDIDKLFEFKFDLNKENSNGLGLYIVSNLLNNYNKKFKVLQNREYFVFKIKLSS